MLVLCTSTRQHRPCGVCSTHVNTREAQLPWRERERDAHTRATLRPRPRPGGCAIRGACACRGLRGGVHLLFDLGEVEDGEGRQEVDDEHAVLGVLGDRVADQAQVAQLGEGDQHEQVAEGGHPVVGQNQRLQRLKGTQPEVIRAI